MLATDISDRPGDSLFAHVHRTSNLAVGHAEVVQAASLQPDLVTSRRIGRVDNIRYDLQLSRGSNSLRARPLPES